MYRLNISPNESPCRMIFHFVSKIYLHTYPLREWNIQDKLIIDSIVHPEVINNRNSNGTSWIISTKLSTWKVETSIIHYVLLYWILFDGRKILKLTTCSANQIIQRKYNIIGPSRFKINRYERVLTTRQTFACYSS